MFILGIELRSPGFTHRSTSQVLTVFWSQTIIQAINNSVVFLQENPESYKNIGKIKHTFSSGKFKILSI